ISAAGRGAGLAGERSGLWREMARVVAEVRPRYVFVENSPILTSRGLGVVLGDLASLGFDAQWGVVSAADTGAPHLRERIWIVAHAQCSERRPECGARHRLAREDGISQRKESAGGLGSRRSDVADSNGTRESQPARSQQKRGMGAVQCSEALANACSERHRESNKDLRPGRNAAQPGRQTLSHA